MSAVGYSAISLVPLSLPTTPRWGSAQHTKCKTQSEAIPYTPLPLPPQAGPYGCLMGILASFFVFIILESNRLTNFKFDLIKLAVVLVILLGVGFLPYIDQWAHLGGFIMGFLLSGVFMPYIPSSEEEKTSQAKERAVCITKYVLLGVGIPLVVLLFVLCFVVFYVAQPVCDNCSYITCPFQEGFTVCTDQTAMLRQR